MKKVITLFSLFSFVGICADDNFLSEKWNTERKKTKRQLVNVMPECSHIYVDLVSTEQATKNFKNYPACFKEEAYLRVKLQALRKVGGVTTLYPTHISSVEELNERMHEEINLITSDFFENNMYRFDFQKTLNTDHSYIDACELGERIKKELHDLVNQ